MKKIPIFLLNGPSGCGKDTLSAYILTHYQNGYFFAEDSFRALDARYDPASVESSIKRKLYELTHSIFNLPFTITDAIKRLFDHRENKEQPSQLFKIEKDSFQISKWVCDLCMELPLLVEDGFYYLTPREALIYVSEVIIKPNFGKDYFAKVRDWVDTWRVEKTPVPFLIDASCGFQEEFDWIQKNSQRFKPVVIQIRGRGEFGPTDSRGWVFNRNEKSTFNEFVDTHTLENTSTITNFLIDGRSLIERILADEARSTE